MITVKLNNGPVLQILPYLAISHSEQVLIVAILNRLTNACAQEMSLWLFGLKAVLKNKVVLRIF